MFKTEHLMFAITKYVQGVQRCNVYKGPCNNIVIHVGATKHNIVV